MDTAYLNTELENGILTITFYHPQSNSLPGVLLSELVNEIELAGEQDEAKVIVLSSAGERAFCAGASFDELLSLSDFESSKYFFLGFAKVINAIRKSSKLVIARVHGKCVGGGVGIAAAADYTIATTSASIKLSELSIGIGPFVVGPAIERKIGLSAFSQLTINATQWKNAQWAKEKGLFMEIYETQNDLDEAVKELAGKIAASSTEATKALKKVFWEGTENWDVLLEKRAEMVGRLALSEIAKKSIAKFKK